MSDIVKRLRDEVADPDWPVSCDAALEAVIEIERLRGVVTTLAQYVADKGAGRVGKYNECCRALESAYGLNWRAVLAATTEGQG